MNQVRLPFPIHLDLRLAEEAVFMFMHRRIRARFWSEREAIYKVPGPEERERRFNALCRREFESLGLGEPLERALLEQPILEGRIEACRVIPTVSAREEGAELFVRSDPDQDATCRSIALRLRPLVFLNPQALLAFLRHELFHIADMVDPAFGYDPTMPEVEGEPMRSKLVLDRYRVLWDAVIDGRLARCGRAGAGAREARRREFEAAFPMLGEARSREFTRWFDAVGPSHRDLLRYALDPASSAGLSVPEGASRGTCPLCRSPGTLELGKDSSFPASLVEEIRRDFADWSPGGGLCRQCLDLYRARPLSHRAAGFLPRG